MSDKLTIFTDDNFKEKVLDSKLPTLVDFWATWCAPCLAIAPHVEHISKEYAGLLQVGKLDVDGNPEVSTQYQVRSIPTLLLFYQGKVVGQLIGAVPSAKLDAFVKDNLAKISAAIA